MEQFRANFERLDGGQRFTVGFAQVLLETP